MDDKTLIERLRMNGKRTPIPCPDGIEGCLVYHFRIETDPLCEEAATRIEVLEARLEIEPSHPYDGIDARDATIRLLEQRIEALETEKRKLALALLAALGQNADALESKP